MYGFLLYQTYTKNFQAFVSPAFHLQYTLFLVEAHCHVCFFYSERTLRRRMAQFNLRRRGFPVDRVALQSAIEVSIFYFPTPPKFFACFIIMLIVLRISLSRSQKLRIITQAAAYVAILYAVIVYMMHALCMSRYIERTFHCYSCINQQNV